MSCCSSELLREIELAVRQGKWFQPKSWATGQVEITEDDLIRQLKLVNETAASVEAGSDSSLNQLFAMARLHDATTDVRSMNVPDVDMEPCENCGA